MCDLPVVLLFKVDRSEPPDQDGRTRFGATNLRAPRGAPHWLTKVVQQGARAPIRGRASHGPLL